MREKIDIAKFAESLQKAAIKICKLGDRDYPQLLSKIYNPPVLFYYCGKMSEKKRIAVVGARKATAYGRNAAQYLLVSLPRLIYVLLVALQEELIRQYIKALWKVGQQLLF